MTYTLKNAQVRPGAASLTTLYTVPGATTTVVSSLVVTNTSSVDTTFRVAVRALGVSISDVHYLYYDVTIPGNDTFVLTGGLTLIATDVVSVYATLATVNFQLFFQEIS
jgi:hypothetical protein